MNSVVIKKFKGFKLVQIQLGTEVFWAIQTKLGDRRFDSESEATAAFDKISKTGTCM